MGNRYSVGLASPNLVASRRNFPTQDTVPVQMSTNDSLDGLDTLLQLGSLVSFKHAFMTEEDSPTFEEDAIQSVGVVSRVFGQRHLHCVSCFPSVNFLQTGAHEARGPFVNGLSQTQGKLDTRGAVEGGVIRQAEHAACWITSSSTAHGTARL